MKHIKPETQLLTYQNKTSSIELIYNNRQIWATQKEIALYYDISLNRANVHINRTIEEDGLDRSCVSRKTNVSRKYGRIKGLQKIVEVTLYNIDVILGVGYRVRVKGSSSRAGQLRIYSREKVKELITGQNRGEEYLEHLSNRDCIKMCADYESNSKRVGSYFADFQNYLHFAITGMTAQELRYKRCHHTFPNMGIKCMTNFKLEDARIAKNYLTKEELESYNELDKIINKSIAPLVANGTIKTIKQLVTRIIQTIQFLNYYLWNGVTHRVDFKISDEYVKNQYTLFNNIKAITF